MEIRFLTTDDAAEYWRLRLEALQRDPEAFSSSAEEHQSLSLDDVRARLSSGTGDFFVAGAIDDGCLLGMAGFYRERGPNTRHKGRVWGIYVTPERRGAGLGRRIMQAVLERGAAINGVEQILLSVTATQTAASALYRALGFQSFGCEPGALKVGDRYIDEEYMVLRLKTRGSE
ncbi:MAG: GNAT family N-acetyltransferase [Candidatus Sulfotelmatobacter sp.]|jgi:ribosomal protein S18 acetylase RimI-like enzyme